MGAELLKWPAIVLGLVTLAVLVYKAIQRGGKARAVVDQSEAKTQIKSRVAEVKRVHPKTARALRDDLQRKLAELRERSRRS